MLNSLIERGGYSRNRQPILSALGITAAALSQYTRGRIRPSFQKLAELADFFGVSLDYLVYGEPVSTPIDHDPIARYVEQALTDVQARSNRHSNLVARIGRLLVDRINDIATEILDSRTAGIEGLADQDEVLRIERYCRQANIVATDLTPNVITVASGSTVPGQFFQVVAANLARGCSYRFLLAGKLSMRSEAVIRFRALIADAVGGDQLNENCAFHRSVFPVIGGLGLYRLDIPMFSREEPWLFAESSKYLLNGSWHGRQQCGDTTAAQDHTAATVLRQVHRTQLLPVVHQPVTIGSLAAGGS